jgi:ABC-type branched-subunit amino acid transport system substrate-binding protein
VKIVLGLSLSLTGAFAPIGRQAEDALRLFVADANAAGGVTVNGEHSYFALRCHDDRGDPNRCAGIYRELCGGTGTDVVLGPYSSRLTAVAAAIADTNGRVLVNHAGSADDLYERGHRMIVGLQTPASQYLNQFLRLLASLKFWRKRLAMIIEPTEFSHAIIAGAEDAAKQRPVRRGGVRIRLKWDEPFDPSHTPQKLVAILRRKRINALVSTGSYRHDLVVMRTITASQLKIPVLACVAAGLSRFRIDLGDRCEGIVGASQWEPNIQAIPELGPRPREFTHRMRTQTRTGECDYIAAQAYAAGVLVTEVLRQVGRINQAEMRERFGRLRTGTLFGAFGIDPETGRQLAHRMLTVQWHQGRKVTIEPGPLSDRGAIEFPSGWRLIAAGARMLKLTRNGRIGSADRRQQNRD